ncbi:MAG: MATE family efflux transporter [Planctomycetes bacterium]|nr:MATE family efflux transporter [Planctomycetota bacterium]MCL4729191.1 MATE family efflux transporter [Planctomycetota bacterium]
MNAPANISRLPAVLYAPDGTRRVDYRAVFALAWPLLLNTGIQAVLNLTDTWFLGRLSVDALAAVGGVFFLILVFVVLLGGVGHATQTLAAQAFGAGARSRAASFAWNGLWATLATAPLFVALAFAGPWLIRPFGMQPQVAELAGEYWFPRMAGGFLGVAVWSVAGFFNGVGRTRLPLLVMLLVALSNAGLNQLMIFELGWGVAGAGWATAAAQAIGVLALVAALLTPAVRREFATTSVMRPRPARIWASMALGFPMGLHGTADLAGFALFQLMIARVGSVHAAASQVVMMLTSVCYMPAIGIALAGTTLVGQSIGAGDRQWAQRTGSAVIKLAVAYMGGLGLLLAAAGPWVLPLFAQTGDPQAAEMVTLGVTLLWIAAGYQVFDALNLGAAFCLRGAGDVKFPAVVLAILAWGLFVPLTHVLTFAPGQGFVDFLPQYGLGSTGAWTAALVYIALLGGAMLWRWWGGAWKKITV